MQVSISLLIVGLLLLEQAQDGRHIGALLVVVNHGTHRDIARIRDGAMIMSGRKEGTGCPSGGYIITHWVGRIRGVSVVAALAIQDTVFTNNRRGLVVWEPFRAITRITMTH